MNVRAYGPPFTLIEDKDYLMLLPTQTTAVWASISDDPTLIKKEISFGCILPPASRTINFWNRGSREDVKFPSILWTLNIRPPHKQLSSHVLSTHDLEARLYTWKIKDSKVFKKPARIGNVGQDGRICWNDIGPKNLREANQLFWLKPFSTAYMSAGFHDCPIAEVGPFEDLLKRVNCGDRGCHCCDIYASCYCWKGYTGDDNTVNRVIDRYLAFFEKYDAEKNSSPWEEITHPKQTILTGESPEAAYFKVTQEKATLGWGTIINENEREIWTPEGTQVFSKDKLSIL